MVELGVLQQVCLNLAAKLRAPLIAPARRVPAAPERLAGLEADTSSVLHRLLIGFCDVLRDADGAPGPVGRVLESSPHGLVPQRHCRMCLMRTLHVVACMHAARY